MWLGRECTSVYSTHSAFPHYDTDLFARCGPSIEMKSREWTPTFTTGLKDKSATSLCDVKSFWLLFTEHMEFINCLIKANKLQSTLIITVKIKKYYRKRSEYSSSLNSRLAFVTGISC